MEFPDLGKHCSERSCNRLDFLPVKCDACGNIYCGEHMTYDAHNCPSAYKKNVQVPVCPLCNHPVPVSRGTLPDIAVSTHIDRDCKFDHSVKVYANKCSMKGCRAKELVPVICSDCRQNFCFKHRHTADHKCGGVRTKTMEAALIRQNNDSVLRSVHGTLTEDEALARALQLSMEECAVSTARSNRNPGDLSRNCALS